MKGTKAWVLGGVQRRLRTRRQRQPAERNGLEWKPGITVLGTREGQGIWSKPAKKIKKMKT